MTLTAGATLQHGRYQLQAVLKQNRWGTAYQALHLGLAQTVVVQSLKLPESILDREQFLAAVRQHISVPCEPQVRLLDCFIESEMLFVALQQGEDYPDLDLHTWSPLANLPFSSLVPVHSELPDTASTSVIAQPTAPETLLTPESNAANVNPRNGHNATPPKKTIIQPVATTLQNPRSPDLTLQPNSHGGSAHSHVQNGHALPNPHPDGHHPTGQTALRSTQTKVTVHTASAHPQTKTTRSKVWIPLALGLTSIAAGLAGASLGWALRTQNPNSPNNPSLLSPILNNEQSFPPIEGWVGDDPVDLSTPLAIPEEPDRSSRRRSTSNSRSEQEVVPEDVAPVRSPRLPEAAVEESLPIAEPPTSLPDATEDIGADPPVFTPVEPDPAPTPEFVPIPPKIKPDYNPPPTYSPAAPPPADIPDADAPPNINGALSDPGGE